MAHRTSKGSSYRIDRRFDGVGRIAVASGANTKKGLDLRLALLNRLYDRGRLDVMRGIKAGTFTITEALDADRRDDLDSLFKVTGDDVLDRPLWETVDAWKPAPRRGRGLPRQTTVKRYTVTLAKLKKSGVLDDEATIGSLGTVQWQELEQTWNGSAADWNHVRRAVSRFLTDQLGSVHDPFRCQVVDLIPARTEVERVPDITPELFWNVVRAAPEHVRACYVTLAASGMDTGEYLALTKDDLHPLTCTISAPGTKTKVRQATISVDPRLWEWVMRAVPSPVQYKWLRLYWKRALAAVKADTTLRLKDLRHCCGQWATDEGVAEAKVQTQLRHATPSMTRRYTKSKDRGEVAHAVADHLLRSA
ncbi:hypothetical protein ACFL3B_00450 [Gemmatimonadota bacterium]